MHQRTGRLGIPLLIVLAFYAFGPVGLAVTLHVSPDGNDAWSGSLARPNADRTDGPLATLVGARDAVRKLKARGPLVEPVRVIVAEGTYFLKDTLVLTPQDRGTASSPITYEAATGAAPVFTGGRSIRGFRPGPDGVWVARVPDVAAGKWYFEQLWVNGRRATRARSPNKFFLYMVRNIPYGIDPLTGKRAGLANRAFEADPRETWLSEVRDEPVNDVTMVAYHSWAISRHRLAEVDRSTRSVIATGPAPWPFMRWRKRQRYHVENFRAALDEPGEWFLSRDGTLYYRPRPDEDLTQAEVVAPVTETFVRFRGEPELGLTVEHVTLRGL